ncbi:MAG: alanine--tRNA ligase, partial [Chitinophagaceae bacterium]|nr:alanine--tRNA ligase [Chitinophagaceae bacterium]
ILEFGKKDNFWEMGDTGPCGPCTEIHVDTRSEEERKKVNGKTLVNADDPGVIEIWNNVFIQYNRLKDGTLQQLPARHVDTGMGFERLVRVIQKKESNYDTDVFTGTIRRIEEITNKEYSNGKGEGKGEVAFRVLADHIRAIAFTIADGQLPSNTGAGYVIRRILRRAVRYYYSYLDYKQPLLHQLISVIADQFEKVFQELKQQQAFISKVIREEEEAFLKTLEKGLRRVEEVSGIAIGASSSHANLKGTGNMSANIEVKSSLSATITGKDAFELYDTYGFPLDLTKLIATEKGLSVDEEGFSAEMQKQKERSRAATATNAEDWIIISDEKINSVFVGYDSLEAKAKILRYRKVKTKNKEVFQIVLDKTPFYFESGGQVGDTGELLINGESLKIIDTKKENDLIIHFSESVPEHLTGEVVAKVDAVKRKFTEVHHSATHLLHAALRQVLGTHVAQKGSLVNADYLRFDFSHFAKMTGDEIINVENLVNEKIRENIPVVIKYMPKEDAVNMGAMALFGEKYGDVVRVVIIDPSYSIELCGGTHVGATGELGFFKILSEGAIAAGVRRIEAVSGEVAEKYIREQFNLISAIRENLKNPKDVLKAIQSLNDENALLKKQIEKFEQLQLKDTSELLAKKVTTVSGTNFVGDVVDVPSPDALKKLAFEIKSRISNCIIVLTSAIEGKAHVVLLLDERVAAERNLDASLTVKQKIAPLIKGGGGGQKTLATAGGQNTTDLQRVIEVVRALL